jgi:hypothetical protein
MRYHGLGLSVMVEAVLISTLHHRATTRGASA